ncbi:PTS system mannose/fructose/sorbose family transporter subunit IID [Enterococcus avium]|uniref:PTS system mannose/fructose/sorbose family transporter subunit IID n=1 Tax=Enterococcus avium TaxID=33945 RepID=UPI0037BBCC7F
MEKVTEEKLITKKDITKSWFTWWLTAETAHSFDRMMGVTFGVSLAPILKKIYTNKEDLVAALRRHTQFFNTNGIWGSLIPGMVIAMEEKKSQGADVPEEVIVGTKTGLMGAVAGVGDTIDWGMWLPIIIGMFIGSAQKGSWVAGIAPWMIFMCITLAESYFLFHLGYKAGESSVEKVLAGGKIQSLISGASVLGLFMMGGLAATYINVTTPLVLQSGGVEKLSIQKDILDAILPGIIPLLIVSGVYVYLEKIDRNFTHAMLIIIALGVLLGAFNILK